MWSVPVCPPVYVQVYPLMFCGAEESCVMCSTCGRVNAKDARFCDWCGVQVRGGKGDFTNRASGCPLSCCLCCKVHQLLCCPLLPACSQRGPSWMWCAVCAQWPTTGRLASAPLARSSWNPLSDRPMSSTAAGGRWAACVSAVRGGGWH